MFTIIVATLSVNIAANVVSPANDFANAFPRWICFSTGGLITGIIGILIQPWRLLSDASVYIFDWLVGYSGGLGSIAGVLVVDYWLLRKKELDLGDLYRREGRYKYAGGWNWRAVIATLLGCFFAWSWWIVLAVYWFGYGIDLKSHPNMLSEYTKGIFDYAWFVGFGVSGVAYYILMSALPPKNTISEEVS